jgi:hypothetical protein
VTAAAGQPFEVGETLFLASAGVVRLVDLAARDARGKPAPYDPSSGPPVFYVVQGDEVTACVPVAQGQQTLRPLVAAPLAQEMLDVLRGPELPLSTEALLERGKRIVHEGSPLEQAQLLRELCGLPAPLSETLAMSLRFVAGLVLPEIAQVLGLSRAALEEELRKRHPAADLALRAH